MIHTCHATGCQVAVPPRLFMCPRHWRMLPTEHRVAVLRHYRPGQEKDKCPSRRYFEAARAAIKWLYAHENGIRRGLA